MEMLCKARPWEDASPMAQQLAHRRPGNAFDRIAAGSRRFGTAVKDSGKQLVSRVAAPMARAASETTRTIVRHSYGAAARAKEPLLDVAGNEGIRLGSHGTAYALDALIPLRALKGWLRPSVAYVVINGVAAALTKGRYRLFFRELAQGGSHHLAATGLRGLHDWIVGPGGAHDGMAGGPSSTEF